MFLCGASKNHEKSIRKMWKWSYKMLVSDNLLVVSRDNNKKNFFWTWKQNLSFQFFDLDIENPLGGGNLAKIKSFLYKLD